LSGVEDRDVLEHVPSGGFASEAMNAIATAQPGHNPGNSPDDSPAQKPTCDDCGERRPVGLNADGRSLCRPCAQRTDCPVLAAADGDDDE